jgi:uncharacterized caspase-like protein
LGFETILKVNASERDMARALRDFEGRLSSGAVGLAFFAGHWIQADGKNYLIPANADIEVEANLDAEASTAQDILAAMERESEEDRSKAEAETILLKGQVEATQRQLTDERGRSWWERMFGGSK